MKRPIRWILWSLGGFAASLLLVLTLLIIAADNPYGRTAIERAVSRFSADEILVSGLGGDFPENLTIQRVELRDSDGIWLLINALTLDWQVSKLLLGEISIDDLQAGKVSLERLPVSTAASKQSSTLSLPLAIDLNNLQVARFEISPQLAGQDANFGIDGQFRLNKSMSGEIALQIRRFEGEGTYSLQASLTDDVVNAHLALHEAAQGPLAVLAGLRTEQAISLEASLAGPWSAVRSQIDVKLDDLQASLGGEINFVQTSVDLSVKATAPAMLLRQDLGWQALALDMQLRGSLDRLSANGQLLLERLNINQIAIGKLVTHLQGADGQLALDGELAGLRLPATKADLFQAEPLVFQAKLGLDQTDYPFSVTAKHPDLAASGQASFHAGSSAVELLLTVPNLQAVATLEGLQLAGSGKMKLIYAEQDADNRLAIDGLLSVVGNNPWAKLLGESAKFDVTLNRQGEDVVLSGLHLDAKALTLSADGGLISGKADFNWQAKLNDLSAIVAAYSGKLAAQGRLLGKLDDFGLSSELKGELASKGYASGPVTANLQLQHLPDAADGRLSLRGELFQAPIDVQLAVNSIDHKTLRVTIDKADWKSAYAKGDLLFTPGNALPVGKIEMKISRLADLQPLLGLSFFGSAEANLESMLQGGQPQARLRLDANHVGLEGSGTIDLSRFDLGISDPTGLPILKGLADLHGISTGKLNGSAQIKLDGPLDALSLRLSAALPDLNGSAAQFGSDALLNLTKNSLLLNSMQANWRQQTLHMLAPAKFDYNDGLTVDRLRFGIQQAELELHGRFSPDLALSAELRNTSAELLSLFMPELALTGTLHADTDLHGSLMQPTGLVRLNADKLQMKKGPGRALPPASLIASAVLHGENADLNLGLKGGNTINLQVAGQVPMTDSGLFSLRGEAGLDLKQLDPLLSADGRRARGQLAMDSRLAGTWSSPILTGNAQIDHGEWQDFTVGLGISEITAALTAEEGTLRIVNLQAKAGPGTLSAIGTVRLLTAGLPIDMKITARNARPLASDQLTVNLNADVALGGFVTEQMSVDGHIHINRADIRIPERLPASIAVLKFSKTTAAQLPAETSSNIALNLTVDATSEIFIRGRGVDAELGGAVYIAGTVNDPHPQGEFKLRKGQFSLAGQNLVFNQGSVGFDGNSLINPSLNFVANTTRNNIAASLSVTGSVRNPKITLSSTPTLPQDEILANLLFGKGTASLSPLEIVQIASTLASLTGVTAGMGDPLDNIRKRLGLDRLSAGGGGTTLGLEAGRYVTPGVYLGAKQGITGGAPQPVLQIDITKHLKLEGGVGSGAAASSTAGSAVTNSLGVIYQIEY